MPAAQVQKTAFLNETDPLWARLRHLHIADAINTVLDDFNQFTKDNKAKISNRMPAIHSA